MPPLVTGKRYSFMLHANRFEAELIEVGDVWVAVRMSRGDHAWIRATSILTIAETDSVRAPRRNSDPTTAWEGASL